MEGEGRMTLYGLEAVETETGYEIPYTEQEAEEARLYGRAFLILKGHPPGPLVFNMINRLRAVRQEGWITSPFKEFRKDGWPFCPDCGNEELGAPHYNYPIDYKPTVEDYIRAGLKCYACGWRDKRFY